MKKELTQLWTKNSFTTTKIKTMTHSKIYQVSEKGTTDTKKIHYVNADNKKQALEVAKGIWNYVNNAEDVTDSHFSEEEKATLPDYVIVAKEWV